MKKQNKKTIYVFIGPSGSGKTTISRLMKEINPETLEFISTTTRQPRQGEQHGVDYYYISRLEFLQKLNNNELVEHSIYSGNHYGLTKDSIENSLNLSDTCVVVLDIHGANAIKKMFEKNPNVNVKLVFVYTKLSKLFVRMKERGDSDEKIGERLDNIIDNKEYENEKFCDYVVDNNGEIEEVREKLLEILNKK